MPAEAVDAELHHVLPGGFAIIARAKVSEVVKSINAGGMSVAPEDLQCVPPHDFSLKWLQFPCPKHRERTRLAGRFRFFIEAGCARAAVAQILIGVCAAVAIRPFDHKVVALAVQPDRSGSQCHGSAP